jgi:hypothetical protein
MIRQNLMNRLNILEKNHKVSSGDKDLIKFLNSLSVEDKERIKYHGSNISFFGESEEWERIMKPFGDTGKVVIIFPFM